MSCSEVDGGESTARTLENWNGLQLNIAEVLLQNCIELTNGSLLRGGSLVSRRVGQFHPDRWEKLTDSLNETSSGTTEDAL
ncbi:hypothetical protein DPEC_G00326260 [Dallia pectoralis]|uniref:Uncharacterized protein n=1 Tax=Dallia pectoralis TaxID=75939 RepID=A0ACC2F7V1_DALPE|nr:hypothetical protein DPEC_G00326260 [Dallia pectoralis]